MADPNPNPDPPKPDNTALTRARQLLDSLWNDKAVGPNIRKKAKELFPDITIPEDTFAPVIEPINAENKVLKESLAALQKRLDDKEKAEAESAANTSMETALNAARKKYGLTDEGFTKMVERMKATKNFSDAEAAAAWVVGEEPPPKPTGGPSWAPQSLDLYGTKNKNDDYALLHKDPDAFFDSTVASILNEAGTA